MSQESTVTTRLLLWLGACDAWGFDVVPPFSEESLRGLGEDPRGDRRLEQEGCHLALSGWHVQVGDATGAEGAERLDVGDADDEHPRIHRHTYGMVNTVREPAELSHPEAWLGSVDAALGGLLNDGLQA